jgi:hypothetical protein
MSQPTTLKKQERKPSHETGRLYPSHRQHSLPRSSRAPALGCSLGDAAHAAGKISRPLRHNGQPYAGVNVLMLWMEATAKGYTAPIWMTYNQAKELGAHVKKDEHGSLVVYANTFTKTETDTRRPAQIRRNTKSPL